MQRLLLYPENELFGKVCSDLFGVTLEGPNMGINIGIKCCCKAANDSFVILKLAELCIKDCFSLLLD